MRISKYIEKNRYSLKNKTVAISGATGGIGRELCSHFAALGASLVLLDRNMRRSEALANELRAKFRGIAISHIQVNMEDIATVKSAAEKLLNMPIYYLVLNAGAYSIPRHKCDTGYDNVFQINFVSPYYLARRLFPLIKERGGRITAVSSIAHNYSKTDADDIDFSSRERASLVYGNSKRFLTYSLLDLYGESGAISIAHPGISFTGITSHYPKFIFAIIKYPMKVIFMRPRKASLSVIKGIFTPTAESEWIGPRLFDVWGLPKKKKLTTANENEIKFISDTAEKIYAKFI